MLSGLGLQLSSSTNAWQPCHVDIHRVLTTYIGAHLTQRFQERERLDIPYCTADFDDDNFRFGCERDEPNTALDLIGNMWDDLYSTTQKITPSFL